MQAGSDGSCKMAAYFDSKADSWDDRDCGRSPVLGAVVAMAGLGEGKRVLDLGCGTGVMVDSYLAADVDEVVGIDVSRRMVEIASEKYADEPRASFACADVYGFASDEPFDAVVIYNAYPHLLDKVALVEKVASLLAPGGRFVVAHGTSRHRINHRHGNLSEDVSGELMPAAEEAAEWETRFDLDAIVDTPGFYAFSGSLRPDCGPDCGGGANVARLRASCPDAGTLGADPAIA